MKQQSRSVFLTVTLLAGVCLAAPPAPTGDGVELAARAWVDGDGVKLAARALHQSGRAEEALEALAASAPLATGLDRLRSQWLEGRIRLDLGELEAAETLLTTAWQGLLAADIPSETADVALDLALLYSQTENTAALARLAAETESIFFALELPNEGIAAVYSFLRAMRKGLASTEAIAQFRGVLDRATRLPRGNGE